MKPGRIVFTLNRTQRVLLLPGGSDGKESACSAGDLGWEDPWRREWEPTAVFLPGKMPWTEKPGGLQSMRSQRVGHDPGTFTFTLSALIL